MHIKTLSSVKRAQYEQDKTQSPIWLEYRIHLKTRYRTKAMYKEEYIKYMEERATRSAHSLHKVRESNLMYDFAKEIVFEEESLKSLVHNTRGATLVASLLRKI